MGVWFFTGSGTSVGKTFFMASCCESLKADYEVVAIKPVVSGWDPNDIDSDPYRILRALGMEVCQRNIDLVSPWRFNTPAAANIAAELDGASLVYSDVLEFCRETILHSRGITFLEGAGGVMSPIDQKHTFLELIQDIECKVVMVTSSYLGSITHTLSSIQALTKVKSNLEIKVILNSIGECSDHSDDISKFIRDYSGLETLVIPRFQESEPEGQARLKKLIYSKKIILGQ